MKTEVILKLTPQEAGALLLTAKNGWGDGSFAEWLNDAQAARAYGRAEKKLAKAIDKYENSRPQMP